LLALKKIFKKSEDTRSNIFIIIITRGDNNVSVLLGPISDIFTVWRQVIIDGSEDEDLEQPLKRLIDWCNMETLTDLRG
jgi:hypothetical protein